MSRYLLVSRSAEYESRLRRLFRSRLQSIPGEYLIGGATGVIDRVEADTAIALLGPLLSFEETRAIVEGLRAEVPDIGVIVVREQRADLEDWIGVLEIHAVLSPEASDSTTSELVTRLERWLVDNGRVDLALVDSDADEPTDVALTFVDLPPGSASTKEAEDDTTPVPEPAADAEPAAEVGDAWRLPDILPGTRTEVIAVASPKGGQGKTTMAVNLATGLAEVAPNSVVLVDADLQFGDIANVLDLEVRHGLDEVVASVDDEVRVKTQLIRHSDDFFVIAAPRSPELADQIDPADLGRLIQLLARMFRYVVIDTTPALGEHTIAALENATDGVFVTHVSVAGLRALRTEFEMLVALELLPANRHIVANSTEKHTGLVLADVEAIVGAVPDVVVPRSVGVQFAANTGTPLIHHDARDPAARAIRALVQRIEPSAFPTRRRIHRKAQLRESE